jgi:cell division protein FtsB
MPLFSPCTADEKLIQKMPAMLPDSPADPAPVRPHARRPIRTALEIHARRRRWLSYGLFAFSLVLLVNAVVGENGYLATLRARQEYDSLMTALTRLQTENQRLRDESDRLRTDLTALEEAARRELGLVRPGETLVIVKDAKPSDPPPVTPAPSPLPSIPR